MRLPSLSDPQKYAGLYVFDFGDHASVGYTATEIGMLWSSGQYPQGQAYRIHRAAEDGTLELEGVSRASMERSDGLLFYRRVEAEAQGDYDDLMRSAADRPPPAGVRIQFARVGGAGAGYLTAILFVGQAGHDVSNWLHDVQFEGGDFVRGGWEEVGDYYAASPLIIEERHWAGSVGDVRPLDQLLATTHLAIQR